MGSGMIGFILDKWDVALLWALIIFGILNAVEVMDNKQLDQIAGATNTTMFQKASSFGVWGLTFNALNPTFRYKLPFTDKYIIGINDIPFFDATDLILIVPIFILFHWLLRRTRLHKNGFYDWILKLLVYVLVILISFLIAKVIEYNLYIWASHNIGMTTEMAIATREQFLENIQDLNAVMLILSIFGGTAIYKAIKERME